MYKDQPDTKINRTESQVPSAKPVQSTYISSYCEAGIGIHAFVTFYILHLLVALASGCSEFSFSRSAGFFLSFLQEQDRVERFKGQVNQERERVSVTYVIVRLIGKN